MNIYKFKQKDCWNFNGLKLPLLEKNDEETLINRIFDETILSNVLEYDELGKKNKNLYEYDNEEKSIKVEKDDVVIDAGAWIGDFSAYCSCVGAKTVYAFEPTYFTFLKLVETSKLNKNIIPIKLGLSDKTEEKILYYNSLRSSANTFNENYCETKLYPGEMSGLVSLDYFVKENNIEKIDFIKSDIEGFERRLLIGASSVLKKMKPKLAISSYHLKTDEEKIKKIILSINDDYKVFKTEKIIFAI